MDEITEIKTEEEGEEAERGGELNFSFAFAFLSLSLVLISCKSKFMGENLGEGNLPRG